MGTRKTGSVALAVLLVVSVSRAQAPHQHEISPSQGRPSTNIAAGSFTSLMMQAMERMHGDMSIVPSGNPDRDFAAMMIPVLAQISTRLRKAGDLRGLALPSPSWWR